MFLFILAGSPCVLSLLVCQHVQQFAHGHVAGEAGRTRVKAARFHLHDLCLAPRYFHPQGAHHPNGPALKKAADVFAPDGRNVFPKSLPEHSQKPVTVSPFLCTHLFKYFGRGGIGFPQGIGKFAVNATVFFLARNREGQNLSFGQILESLEHRSLFRSKRTVENRTKPPRKSLEAGRGRNYFQRISSARGCWSGTFVLSFIWDGRPTFLRVRSLYGFFYPRRLLSVFKRRDSLGKR